MAFNVSYTFEAIDKFSGTMQKISSSITSFQTKLSKVSGSIKKTGQAMEHLGRQMLLRVTAPIIAVGTAAIKASDDLEQLRNRVGMVNGSMEEGTKFYKELVGFMDDTPLPRQSIEDAAIKLKNLGFATKEVTKTLSMLGDVSVGANVDINVLATQFGKAKQNAGAASRAFMALSGTGIPMYSEMQKLGKEIGLTLSPEQIKKLASAGKITSDIMNELFLRMTQKGGIYYQQLEKAKGTLKGLGIIAYNTFHDQFLGPLGDSIVSIFHLKERVKALVDYLQSDKFKVFMETHKHLIKIVIICAAVAAALAPILVIAGMLVITIGALLSPIGLIFVALGLILGMWIKNKLQTESISQLIDELKNKFHILHQFVSKNFSILKAIGVVIAAIAIVLMGPLFIFIAIVTLLTLVLHKFGLLGATIKIIGAIIKWAILEPIDAFITGLGAIIDFAKKAKHLAYWKTAPSATLTHLTKATGAKAPTFTPVRHQVTSNVNINIHDPTGVIKEVKAETKGAGSTHLNVGKNMAMSRAY